MFKFSLMYLPLVLGLMALHRTPNNHSVGWAEIDAKASSALGLTAATVELEQGAAAEVLADGSCSSNGNSGVLIAAAVALIDGLRAAVGDFASRIDGDIVLSYVTKCPSKVHCKDLPRDDSEQQSAPN